MSSRKILVNAARIFLRDSKKDFHLQDDSGMMAAVVHDDIGDLQDLREHFFRHYNFLRDDPEASSELLADKLIESFLAGNTPIARTAGGDSWDIFKWEWQVFSKDSKIEFVVLVNGNQVHPGDNCYERVAEIIQKRVEGGKWKD